MAHTQRLNIVELREQRGFFPFRKRPPPDTVLIGQYVLRVADACIEQLRVLPEEYQVRCWELVEQVLRDAKRKQVQYDEGEGRIA